MNKTFIIILHYGDPQITIDCIRSIFKQRLEFEKLIVVDNNQNFKTSFNGVKIIRNKKNLGFAGGVNVGIKYAISQNADYVLLLNNDTMLNQDILKPLIKFLQQFKNAGIVGPAIKFKREEKFIYDLGGKINKIFGRTSHTEASKIQNTKPRVVDYVSGCCMLIKKDVFEKVGLFDERFFLYYEDVDLCIRAKDKGFFTYVVPSVYIEHALSKTIGKVSKLALYHQTKSGLQFGKKHLSSTLVLNRLFIIVQSLIIFVKNPVTGGSVVSALFKYI